MHGVEALASPDDCLLAEQIAKADPKVREQLKLRGVTDIDLVACDPWSGVQSTTATKCSKALHAVMLCKLQLQSTPAISPINMNRVVMHNIYQLPVLVVHVTKVTIGFEQMLPGKHASRLFPD